MAEIEGKESRHKLHASPETLRLIGSAATHIPDIADKDVIIVRLSDIVRRLSEEETRRNAPFDPPPLTEKFNDVLPPPAIPPEKKSDTIKELTGDFYKRKNEFMKDLGKFAERNGFEKKAFLALNIDGFYAHLSNTAGYAVHEARNETKNKTLTVITMPDQPFSDDAKQNLIAILSASRSVRIKNPEDFDIHTASVFSLFHEAGHLRILTPSGMVNETMADRTAKETLEKFAESGDKKIHLKTLETIADLRSISALQKLFPEAVEKDYGHSHSTGTLSGEPYPEMLEKEASHIETLKHLNGFISSLIGSALRPAADMLMNERGDLEDLKNYRKNWQDKSASLKEEMYGTHKILDDLAQSPDLYLSATPAIVALKAGMIKGQTQSPEIYNAGNMRLGNAFAQQNPGIHYAFIKGMYDAGLFEGNHPVDAALQKRYVERYLEAFERVAEITPEERALAKNLATEMKKAKMTMSDILPGTPDPLHPPDRKPEVPESALKTAPPQP